jgi:hypothetical protein
MIPTRDLTGEGETTPLTMPLKLTLLRKIGRTHPLCSTGHFTLDITISANATLCGRKSPPTALLFIQSQHSINAYIRTGS